MAEDLTAELLAQKFANGNSLERYMGKWLLLSVGSQATDRASEDRFAELREIPVIRSLLGSEKLNMADILKSWYPGGKHSINTRLLSLQGLLVGEVQVFKASRTECLGRQTKYLAFGTRPLVPVKRMYPIASDFSSTPSTSCAASCGLSATPLRLNLAIIFPPCNSPITPRSDPCSTNLSSSARAPDEVGVGDAHIGQRMWLHLSILIS